MFDSDGLAGEHLAEIDFLPIEADATAGRDGDDLVVERIVEVRQAPILPWRGPIALRWTLHVERLMRPLVVVAIDEVVELALLLKEVVRRWFGRLQLQGQMHTLVAAVLLRVAGLDAFDCDPEPEPPDREFGQVEECVGTGEGHAVIGADGSRQAKLLEYALEYRESIGFLVVCKASQAIR